MFELVNNKIPFPTTEGVVFITEDQYIVLLCDSVLGLHELRESLHTLGYSDEETERYVVNHSCRNFEHLIEKAATQVEALTNEDEKQCLVALTQTAIERLAGLLAK